MPLNKKNIYFIYLIIILGFLYSCFVSFKYLKKYDVIDDKKLINSYFFAKEGGTPTFWHEAHDIKTNIKKKGYFKSGYKYEFEYLPSKLIFFYYKIINEDIKVYDDTLKKEIFKINNTKFGLIIFQNLIYYFSVLYLFLNVKKLFSNDLIFFISLILFICFEPTINQWNRVLYSETILFSIQLLIISILFNYKKTNHTKALILGALISLMYLQRSVSIFYIFIIFFYFAIFFRKKFLTDFLIIIFLYLFTHLFLGFHNLKKDGEFYSVPILQKEDLYGYFIPKIIKYNKDPLFTKNFVTRHDSLTNFVELNNLKSEQNIKINDRLSIANVNMSKAFRLISEHPIESFKEYLISCAHFFLLKPNEIHFLFENNISYGGNFYLSEKFQKEKLLKFFYSILIYLISFFGLLFFIINKLFHSLFILVCSILYFSIPVVWHIQSSYLGPILIYLSIFFSAGLLQIRNMLKN